jgi:shikimate kinase
VIELIGPAGAGKTSVLRALVQRSSGVQPGIEISRQGQLPFVVRNSASLLPLFLGEYRHSRWFSRRESRSMAYLTAWQRALRRRGPDDAGIVVFDHGPLYRLALLREFGPDLRQSGRYRRWWRESFEAWVGTLDAVVWLDATTDVLLMRVRGRDSWHPIKEKSEAEASAYLRAHRVALERIIDEAAATRPLDVLRFDTAREPAEEIAHQVLESLHPRASAPV